MSLDNFITQILNIKEVELEDFIPIQQSDGSSIIKLRLKPKPMHCPFCGKSVNIHGYYLRKLLHATLVDRKCVIFYQQRRYRCPACEFTFHEDNPFINTSEGLTYETKVNILKDLKWAETTYTFVAKRYKVSPTTVMRIFDKHVNIPRKPLPRILSMDEHYFPASDFDSLYCCLVMDFETGELVDILPDRKKSYLIHYLSNIKKDSFDSVSLKSELSNVQYLSIDLYDNFRSISKTYLPKAIICADSFHVLQHLTKDFHDVRLRCRRNTENKVLQYLLTKFKYIFSHDAALDNTPKYNKRLKQKVNHRDIRDILFAEFPELGAAYELKEFYIRFNRSSTIAAARANMPDIINMFADCGIPEYDEFYTLLSNWSEEIINSFILINGSRISNGPIEAKNKKVEKILRNANGFANFTRTRNRILYVLNEDAHFTL